MLPDYPRPTVFLPIQKSDTSWYIPCNTYADERLSRSLTLPDKECTHCNHILLNRRFWRWERRCLPIAAARKR